MTGSREPRVTLGLPVYNGADYLSQALDSVLAQDFTDFELLIRDNASTDSTEEIARGYVEHDPRIHYERNERNLGGAVNSNLLLDEARGELFKWVYHDDLMHSSAIRRCVEVLDERGADTVLAFPRVRLINSAGDVTGEHDDADLHVDSDEVADRIRTLLVKFVTQTQFGVMRTEAARAAGGTCADVAGEMVLPLALALRGKLALVPEQLLSIREHEDRHGGDRASEAAWVNPDRPRAVFPYSRATPLFLRTVADAPLTASQRRSCYSVILRHFTLPNIKTVFGDVIRLPWDAGWLAR
ncbi:glycosyltransferase family 2 protein [Micropruina glycogenica]|uniref:Glycosyl transferase family 2 n=1 Tax=Micropruina glycogenica TaxID=75385 RepID=A0A2N9JAC0_9ACTN|nr:glycosyltransferase family A protein [Micropruina glycogenica]SPD85132.1 Glycosyl transferase family 2 [Micropruina glycogenica]